MGANHFYIGGSSPALTCAIQMLTESGCDFSGQPTHLLLPVPSLRPDGTIIGGGDLNALLAELPKDITIIGGNLPQLTGYKVWDLLKDPAYVAENAYITAHCAVRLAMDRLPIALRHCKVLVIGWGRIGKCLAALLKGLEADVTVAARKEADRAILHALGYGSTDTEKLNCSGYRVIFNTAPATILPKGPAGCLKIDLASTPGIGGSDVIHARGLPGKDAPEASGELIARTVLRFLNKEDTE